MLLKYEKAVSDALVRFIDRHYGKVLPHWVWRRVLLSLPTFLACILRPIRFVLGFAVFMVFVPFLLWPPFWRDEDD